MLTGTTATFRGYGFMCLLVLAGFIFINFYRKETGFVSELPATEDPHQVKISSHESEVIITIPYVLLIHKGTASGMGKQGSCQGHQIEKG